MLLDLYSGTGTIALSLAARFRLVVGAECAAGAVRDARANAAHNNISNAQFLEADLATPEGVAAVAARVPRPDAVVAGALPALSCEGKGPIEGGDACSCASCSRQGAPAEQSMCAKRRQEALASLPGRRSWSCRRGKLKFCKAA